MTQQEATVVGIILLVIGTLSYFNFARSQILARDVQRKNDLKHIAAALSSYLYDFGSYPKSEDGKILACGTSEDLQPCNWGKDKIADLNDPGYPPYIDPLPDDPLAPPKKYYYVYLSNTKNFQLLAHLERLNDVEYKDEVAKRMISCGGGVICNFAIANGGIPIDRDLEQVEQEATGGARRSR